MFLLSLITAIRLATLTGNKKTNKATIDLDPEAFPNWSKLKSIPSTKTSINSKLTNHESGLNDIVYSYCFTLFSKDIKSLKQTEKYFLNLLITNHRYKK